MNNSETKKHKWIKADELKICEKCGSKIVNKLGFHKYFERDFYGVLEPVNWYPRCLVNQK